MSHEFNFKRVRKDRLGRVYYADCFSSNSHNGEQEKELSATSYIRYNKFKNELTWVILPFENGNFIYDLVNYTIKKTDRLSRKIGMVNIIKLTEDLKPFEYIFLENGYGQNGENVLHKIYN